MRVQKNGHGRITVPDELERERHLEAAQRMAHAQAVGAFRGTVATMAGRIVAAVFADRGVAPASPEERDALADDAVDMARRVVIASQKCEFPTVAELGQDEADEASGQEG